MKIEITSGPKTQAIRCLIYGPEGIGKSTFASQWPDPLYIDTEGSTNTMDVKRLPKPVIGQDFLELCDWVAVTKPCRTLVVDTVDWLEKIIQEDMCREAGKSGIEDWGYGKGYTYLTDRMTLALNALDKVVAAGINVLLVAHAQVKKVEAPGLDPYDHWELKLQKRNAPLFKEWVDMLLFTQYEINTVSTQNGNKIKATGGKKRIMHTCHTAICDAKNRFGLDDELPLDFESIAWIFEGQPKSAPEAPKPTLLDALIETCAVSGIDRDELEEYCWASFDSPEIMGKGPDEWPEGFIEMLLDNWGHVMEDLRPSTKANTIAGTDEDGDLDISREDLPF